MTEKDSMLEVFTRTDSESSKLSSKTDPEVKSSGKLHDKPTCVHQDKMVHIR